MTEEVTAKLIKSANHQIERDGILATRLCTHKDDVDLTNENKLQQLPGLNSSDCPAHKKKKHVLLCLAWIQLKMDNTYGNLVIIHFLSRVWSVLPGNLRNVWFIYFPNCFINWHRHFWSSEQKTIALWKAQTLTLFPAVSIHASCVYMFLPPQMPSFTQDKPQTGAFSLNKVLILSFPVVVYQYFHGHNYSGNFGVYLADSSNRFLYVCLRSSLSFPPSHLLSVTTFL